MLIGSAPRTKPATSKPNTNTKILSNETLEDTPLNKLKCINKKIATKKKHSLNSY